MQQNTFLTTPVSKKYLFCTKVFGGLEVCANASKNVFNHSKYAQIHQKTFLTTPDSKKYLFSEHFSGDLEVCENASKHVFNHSSRSKTSFLKKRFCWYGSMRKCIKTPF
jgi:hypothetical protein